MSPELKYYVFIKRYGNGCIILMEKSSIRFRKCRLLEPWPASLSGCQRLIYGSIEGSFPDESCVVIVRVINGKCYSTIVRGSILIGGDATMHDAVRQMRTSSSAAFLPSLFAPMQYRVVSAIKGFL